MKCLVGTILTLAFSVVPVSSGFTGLAVAQTTSVSTSGQATGQIESIDGSTIMVRTANGTVQMYQIDPETLATLKLRNGSTVLVNRYLMGGVVTDVNPSDVRVKLDNGSTETFLITEAERLVLSEGDRVYVTPSQRIVRGEDYILTARDISLVQPVIADTTTIERTQQTRTIEVSPQQTTTIKTTPQEAVPLPQSRVETTVETSTPAYRPPATPVRALW